MKIQLVQRKLSLTETLNEFNTDFNRLAGKNNFKMSESVKIAKKTSLLNISIWFVLQDIATMEKLI